MVSSVLTSRDPGCLICSHSEGGGVEKEKLRITAQQLPSLNSIGSDKTQHDDVQLILRTRFDFIYWGCNPADWVFIESVTVPPKMELAPLWLAHCFAMSPWYLGGDTSSITTEIHVERDHLDSWATIYFMVKLKRIKRILMVETHTLQCIPSLWCCVSSVLSLDVVVLLCGCTDMSDLLIHQKYGATRCTQRNKATDLITLWSNFSKIQIWHFSWSVGALAKQQEELH